MTIANLSKNISKSLKYKKLKFSELSQNKNLFKLSLTAFFLLVIVATFLGSQKTEITHKIKNSDQVIIADRVVYPPLPVLDNELASSFPVISAQAALAIDLDSKVTLYEKDPDGLYLPASTTKIITALVALNHFDESEVLRVNLTNFTGQKMGLSLGEEIRAGDLIDGLLIYSANDAAEVLADNFPGGRDTFIKEMNKLATSLNLYNSHFENPTGFDGGRHFSTARDLVKAASVAMQDERFSRIVGQKQKTVASADGKIIHNLVNTNELLGKEYGVLGVKTGWTENARENLVTYIERDGKKIMIALLGSQDRFGETKELINWMFANYEWKEVEWPGK